MYMGGNRSFLVLQVSTERKVSLKYRSMFFKYRLCLQPE